MLFQSKKKRLWRGLWRARVTESAATTTTPNNLQPPPPHLQHQRHLPPQLQSLSHRPSVTCSSRCGCPSSIPMSPCYNSSDCGNSPTLASTHSSKMLDANGCCLENCGENMFGFNEEDYDQTLSEKTMMVEPTPVQQQRQTTMASTMAATAANVFRNCCGGGCLPTDSINNNNCFPTINQSQINHVADIPLCTANDQKKMFALVSKLKMGQLITLEQAVENRGAYAGHQPDCVLVPRGLIMGEEPHVIACRIWLWPDLQSSQHLKSIPSCPNENDRVYVCCNPTHWSRLTLPDTPPPPYQLLAMNRLKSQDHGQKENQKDGEYTKSSTSGSIVPRGRFPGSLTTDGEDASPSSVWCQLAYWEMSQRVGGRFSVENNSVNIFSDQPRGDGMCLKTLAEQKQSRSSDSVLKTRQKIGLGITLSQEADGVWLYNRSSAPVFVHSPTLNDINYWFHVSKVQPGYCLKAFDNYRAFTQNLIWPPQIAGAQSGPVDINSMRISFAKGWGPNYSRQDVTACPCWLEVLFARR